MYWSKDKCKESVEAFNEDRHNFEHFLHVYVQATKKRDLDRLQSSTSKFLDNFPQKCMYLEMCLLPSFYIMILEKLLNQFEAESQPVHTVEFVCLLGHEKRKVGTQAQYKDLMKKAKQVYARNCRTEFRTNSLSRLLFFNSYTQFLSITSTIPSKWELVRRVDEKALILCKKKLSEHPETAATLLFVGRHRKSMQHFQEAIELFKRCLGEHVMTAQCHKAIADFYFVNGNSEVELDKSFEHNREALDMMETLGMGGRKESILTLKNYRLCHKLKENFQQAIEFLAKAKQVADIELEEDHKWKVMIETQLAVLYNCVGRVEDAKLLMKKGLEMNQRLDQSINKLANRSEIELFLKCYPDTLI
ncbi:uncharacterized protein LOC144645159 [Oculina patagonica]